MAQRHKWADVIIAFAEGKQIQFGQDGVWYDTSDLNGIHFQNYEWRIKPEKKRIWINIYDGYSAVNVFKTREFADDGSIRNRVACIEIEYEEGEGLDSGESE